MISIHYTCAYVFPFRAIFHSKFTSYCIFLGICQDNRALAMVCLRSLRSYFVTGEVQPNVIYEVCFLIVSTVVVCGIFSSPS